MVAAAVVACGGGGGGRAVKGIPFPDGPAYTGSCDASAAVGLSGGRFLVADDEDNHLRVYRRDPVGAPLEELDAGAFMVLDPRRPEADIEGAARDGDVIYWISSHGLSSKGKRRASRLQFFATRIVDEGDTVRLEAVGKPYTTLLDAISPSGDAVNIEGLALAPDGAVLLGLRAPLAAGKAVVFVMRNPKAVLEGAAPDFAAPIHLDLGGLGIRSIERFRDGYIIAAGPSSDERRARLFLWDGASTVTPIDEDLGDFMPEAVIVDGEDILMLSDDGSLRVGARECKRSPDRRFRGRTLRAP